MRHVVLRVTIVIIEPESSSEEDSESEPQAESARESCHGGQCKRSALLRFTQLTPSRTFCACVCVFVLNGITTRQYTLVPRCQ